MTRPLFILLTALVTACGPQNSEVWLQIQEDSSRPCLGASHVRLSVHVPGHSPETMIFDSFGLFFDSTTFRCQLQEWRYPGLPLGGGLGVEVQLTDSSTDAKGILADVSSSPFNVAEGSPIQQVSLSLFRLPEAQQGTVVVYKPRDWGVVGGIRILGFRVIREADGSTVRAYYISYDPVHRPDPFPVVISNLPLPQPPVESEIYMFYLDGMDANRNILRTWSGPIYLAADRLAEFSP